MDHLWIIYGSRIMSVMGCLDSWFGTGGFNRQKQQKGMGNEQLAVRIASPKYALGISQYQGISSGFLGLSKLSSQKTGYQESITWFFGSIWSKDGFYPKRRGTLIHPSIVDVSHGFFEDSHGMTMIKNTLKAAGWKGNYLGKFHHDLTATEPWNHG